MELGEIVILPVLPLIRAGGDAKRRGGIDRRRLPRAQGQSMNIALEGIGSEGGQMHPVIATIATLVHAVHLDTGPDDAVVSGVHNHVGRARDADRAGQGHA